jgi:hypothetical protein
MNKTQRRQMAYFTSVIEPFCDEPILGLAYLFTRGAILNLVLGQVAGQIPVPDLPDRLVEAVHEKNVERTHGRQNALCAVTASTVTVVGVAARAAAGGLTADFWDLTVTSEPLVLRRDEVTIEVKRRLVSKVVTITDTATDKRYDFEVHVFGTADFNDAFFSALTAAPPA